MTEYSEWTNIRHKKAKGNSKRSNFTEITKNYTLRMETYFFKHVGNMVIDESVSFLCKQKGIATVVSEYLVYSDRNEFTSRKQVV